jgi:hypothetical protein
MVRVWEKCHRHLFLNIYTLTVLGSNLVSLLLFQIFTFSAFWRYIFPSAYQDLDLIKKIICKFWMGKTNNFFLSYDAFFVLIIHYGYNSAFEISAFSPIRHSWFRHSRILNSVQLGPTWKSYSRFRNSAFSSIEGLDIQVISAFFLNLGLGCPIGGSGVGRWGFGVQEFGIKNSA